MSESPISRFIKRLSGSHKKSPKENHNNGVNNKERKKNLMEQKLSMHSSFSSSSPNDSGKEDESPETISVPSSPQVACKFNGNEGGDITFDSKHFKVIKKIGKGNYGKVLLVQSNGSLFALKEQKIKAGFGQEVDLHLKISQEGDHENIIKLYYASSGRGKVGSIALEYCDGMCMDHLINKLNENDIKFIAREILRGISFLHAIKIIHRDIKPENIMVSSNGQVKIIDFGMALNSEKETADQAFGSPLYMAPEMITCIDVPEIYNEKVDIWALGITIIEMSVGILPHMNITKTSQLVKTVKGGDAPSLSSMTKEAKTTKVYSKDLHDFISQCLTKDPTARPSASSLLSHSLFQGIDAESAMKNLSQKVHKI
eukprot:TRINITY_DN687_c0_g2_i3.p1 TRINITY_DN687_c0_g2~~TRINITY_DN687_c0_g2_i3.p1  ORF type:complete len:371 (-),score=106.00 TRINITY_DN687_c0_g2_i3:116-1228(-)